MSAPARQVVRGQEMSFIEWRWLFLVAITLHNREEAIWLPAWSKQAGKLVATVNAFLTVGPSPKHNPANRGPENPGPRYNSVRGIYLYVE